MKTLFLLIGLLVLTQFSAFARSNNDQFLSLIDEAIALRNEGIEFYNVHKSKFGSDGNLTHKDIENIYNFSTLYLKNREKIFKHINSVTSEVSSSDKVIFSFDKPSEVKWGLFGKKHYLNLNEAGAVEKLRDIKMATAFGLLLFDNYLALISPYYSHSKIRFMLNQDYPEGKDELDAVTESFFSSRQRKKFFQGLEIFNDSKAAIKKGSVEVTDFDLYLDRLIETSPMLEYLKTNGTIEPRKFTRKLDELFDDLNIAGRTSTYYTSKLFGNTMGIFQSRSGLLKNITPEEKNYISRRMKPLDILLEKTPFRLTDSFIPGYYGHVAIWVGTETELRELGLWDHPAVRPHQDKIRNGHSIVEALRPGVQINTLDHFLDIDDLAVLRPNSLNDDQVKEYLVRAFMQIGKKYDFNFDVETDKEIVCSEIAYVVYHNVVWPTDRTLGRATISPDHVAWKALPNREFTPMVLYKNGKEEMIDVEGVFKSLILGPEGLKGAEAPQ